jgi:hypothetical protein
MVFIENLSTMKKILNILATVALLCALMFIGGEWPEDTPRKKVLTCDGVAIVTMLATGLYLRREDKHGRLR